MPQDCLQQVVGELCHWNLLCFRFVIEHGHKKAADLRRIMTRLRHKPPSFNDFLERYELLFSAHDIIPPISKTLMNGVAAPDRERQREPFGQGVFICIHFID
jgi:hypothetical protein